MTTTITDPRAWTAATVDRPESWHYRLSPACLAILDAKDSTPRTTDLRLSVGERATLARELEEVRRALEDGRGFVILEGLPKGWSPDEVRAAYWLVGLALGEPVEQNVQGELLYEVRDTGRQLAEGARFSVTNYESSFHTDNSFGDGVADVVGLLCLQTARAGGLSQVVSGHAVRRVLATDRPEALAVLCRPFHVDRRGGVRPGEAPTVERPVIEETGQGLLFRYLRFWIEAGHHKAGLPLTPTQRAALDALDEVLRRAELRVEFTLRPGQMLLFNNRWLLHNRTAFEDHPEPERRRHLVRLWLRSS
jgi:alpha-ketoglutarate-dependent taurine dioxygenase